MAASAAESHQLVTQEKSWQLPLTVQHALIWIPVYPVWVTKHVTWAKYKYGGISPTNYGHKRWNIVKVCVKYVSRPLNSCPWLKDFNQSSVGALKNIIVIFKWQCQKDDDGTFDTDTEWDKVDFQKVLFEFAYSVKEVTKLKIKWKLPQVVLTEKLWKFSSSQLSSSRCKIGNQPGSPHPWNLFSY